MAFAQEIRDFLAAYNSVSQTLQGNERLDLTRQDIEDRRKYRDWLMGAEGREEDAMVEFATSGDVLAPLEPGRAAPRGGGGGADAGDAMMNYAGGEGDFADLGGVRTPGDAASPVSWTGASIDQGDFDAIMASAARLGADPRQYLSILNFESGLDPSVRGGEDDRHIGLIQFGPTEQATFGANQQQTIPEQLPAVEAYLTARGWQPGMDMAHMYSIINTGGLDEDTGEPRWGWADDNGTLEQHIASIEDEHGPIADRLMRQYASLEPEGYVAELAGFDPEAAAASGYEVPEGEDVDMLTGRTGYAEGEEPYVPDLVQGGNDPLGLGDADYQLARLAENQPPAVPPQTTIASPVAAAPEVASVEVAPEVAQAEEMAGQPFTPEELVTVLDSIVQAHRDAGDNSPLTYNGQLLGDRVAAVPDDDFAEAGAVPEVITPGVTTAYTDADIEEEAAPVVEALEEEAAPVETVPPEEVPAAIPEEGEAPPTAPTGFDPLPQTSGRTDRVARTGDANMVFAAMDAPPPPGLLKAVFNFADETFGVKPRPAVDDGTPDPGREAKVAGVGAADITFVERMEDAIRQRFPGISQEQTTLRVMSTIFNWWNGKGQPQRGIGAAYSIMALYEKMAGDLLEISKVAAENGDFDEAIERFAEAYSLIPDGEVINAVKNPDGTYTITTIEEATGETIQKEVNLDAKEIVSTIMGITPRMFEEMIESKFVKEEDKGDEATAGAIETMPGAEGVPTAPDEVVPTAPSDDTGGLGPEVPAGAEDEESPMGITVPPDQSRFDEDTGEVRVASTDPNAPVAMPEIPKAEPPKPPEQGPRQPMDMDQFRVWAAGQVKKGADLTTLYTFWNKEWEIYDNWKKNQPTQADIDALKAYNTAFAMLQTTPEHEYFNLPEQLLATIDVTTEGGKRAADTIRAATDAHNQHYQTLVEEERVSAEKSADERSAERLQEIEQGLYLPEEELEAQPVTPGPMPGEFQIASEPTVPTGMAAIPEEEYAIPPEASSLQGDEYEHLATRMEQRNQPIRERNKTRFAPVAPLDLASPQGQAQADRITNTSWRTYVDEKMRNAEGNPDAAATFALFQKNVTEKDLMPHIIGGTLEILRTPGNVGITEQEAVASIASMLTVFAEDPTAAPYTARHIDDPNMPAGLVEVNIGGDTFNLPVQVYDRIDAARAEMAFEQYATVKAAREAGVTAGEYAERRDEKARTFIKDVTTKPIVPLAPDEELGGTQPFIGPEIVPPGYFDELMRGQ